MKKEYVKPVLAKRDRLADVSAVIAALSGQINK